MTALDTGNEPQQAKRQPDIKELVFGIAVAALIAAVGLNLDLTAAPLIGIAFLAALGLYDARTSTIHRLTVRIGTAAVLATTAIEAAIAGEWTPVIGATIASIGLYLLLLPIWMLPSRPLGGGDLRLAVLIGATTGPYGAPLVAYALFAGFAIAAIIGLPILVVTKRRSIPLGPGLAAGAIIRLATTVT